MIKYHLPIMLIMTSQGLYCPAGNFYIDPKKAVDHAVITHAHSDHARKGSKHYYCASTCHLLLKARLGQHITVTALPFGKRYSFGAVQVSFHPAGHILGSAQIRLELAGEVWVVSGDYKREHDATSEAFEPLRCDVFITEATFGTPAFCWQKSAQVDKDIVSWWYDNAKQGINSVLFAYSLGKTQRVLNMVSTLIDKSIYCDSSAKLINNCYQAEQVDIGSPICLSTLEEGHTLKGELIIAPPSFLQSKRAVLLGKRFETAFASGWMARTHHSLTKGFVLSDHADWNDLLFTIKQTGAKRVYVQHRGRGSLVRHLRSIGIKAYPDRDLFPKNPSQLSLF